MKRNCARHLLGSLFAGCDPANGGNGELFNGGGGGGGRIAVYSASNNFVGTYSVLGGDGFADGQTGTLFLSSNSVAPIVISQTPTGVITNAGVTSITLYFNVPVNPGSASGGFQLLTPAGPLAQSNVVVTAAGASGLRFSFPIKTYVGDYTIIAGPPIASLFGQPISQVYTGAFSISLPVIEGFVTDTNGQPVLGVFLQPNNAASPATTGSNGEYAIGVPPGTGLTITPNKSGYMFVPGSRTYAPDSGSISNENYLAVTTIAPNLATELQGTNFVMRWIGISGVTYQLYFSTNLIDWQASAAPILGTNGPMQIPINVYSTDPTYVPIGFYRLGATN